MAQDLATQMKIATDPALIGWPPLLATEIALREQPVKDVCASYGIGLAEWQHIAANPIFVKELEIAVNSLKTEGMSFKIKARLQSEELLKESWKIIHDEDTPVTVKADLIKHTIRIAGLDASKEQAQSGGNAQAFQININL